MLNIGWPEMLLVLVLALMIIGPKDLPKAMYGLGKMMRKVRLMSRAFQDSLDELVREAEIDDIKKQAQSAQRHLIEEIDIEDDMRDLMTAADFDDDFDHEGTTPDLIDTERPKPRKKAPAKKKTAKKPAKKATPRKTTAKKSAPKKPAKKGGR